MARPGLRLVPPAPAQALRPPAQIQILVKSEEILVEYLSVGSHLLQRRAAIERCGAAHREDIACLLELPLVGGVVTALHGLAAARQKLPCRIQRDTVEPQQLTGHHPDFRMRRQRRRGAQQIVGLQDHVRVEKQDGIALRARPAEVRGAAEPQVVAVLHHHGAGGSRRTDTVVLRAVVHHHYLDRRQTLCPQGLQALGQERSAVPGHDDHRHTVGAGRRVGAHEARSSTVRYTARVSFAARSHE